MMSRSAILALTAMLLCSLVACNLKIGNQEEIAGPGQPDINTPEGKQDRLVEIEGDLSKERSRLENIRKGQYTELEDLDEFKENAVEMSPI